MISTPLCTASNDWERDENEMQKVEECRRILLAAGADPTLTGGEEENFLRLVVLGGASVSFPKLDIVS